MGSVTIVVLVDVILGNRLAPRRTAFELLVMNIDTSVNNVDIDTLARIDIILILGKGSKGEFGSVANACETLIITCLSHFHGETSALLTYPGSRCLDILSLHNLVTLNIIDFRHFPDPLEDLVRELSCVAFDMAVEYVTDAAVFIQVWILCMCCMKEIVVIIQSRQRQVLLQHDNVRVIDEAVRSFVPCRMKGSKI